MAERLGPPPKKTEERFDNWVFRLWKLAFGALSSDDIGVTAPIIVTTSGTGTLNIGHGTSGAVTGTYGSQSRIPIFAVDTYGHLTLATSSDVAIAGTAVTGSDLTFTSPILGTATNALLRGGTIAHATSGAIPGTYGSQSAIPIFVVNTYGHVTLATSSDVAAGGTSVTGADLSLTAPIIFGTGTGTNILLRSANIAHATSGAIPGTYGGTAGVPRVVVNTYGHVTAVSNVASVPPFSIQNGNYTFGTGDLGGVVYREGTATGVSTWTVPSTLGTSALITIVNDGTGNVTVTPVDDLIFAGTGATGNRTLPQYGMASLLSVTASRWLISGAGVS